MMAFDEWCNGVHVAYVITSNAKQKDLDPWMNALNDILLLIKQNWCPNAFIVDDAKAKTNSLW
jgi:hypothetical protein